MVPSLIATRYEFQKTILKNPEKRDALSYAHTKIYTLYKNNKIIGVFYKSGQKCKENIESDTPFSKFPIIKLTDSIFEIHESWWFSKKIINQQSNMSIGTIKAPFISGAFNLFPYLSLENNADLKFRNASNPSIFKAGSYAENHYQLFNATQTINFDFKAEYGFFSNIPLTMRTFKGIVETNVDNPIAILAGFYLIEKNLLETQDS
jgi:hypothetical protein